MTVNYQIRYSPEALEDLRKIFAYIKFDLLNPDAAQRQADAIRKKIYELELFPYKYAAVDWEPWKSAGMRKLPVDNYVVYYLINEKTFNVVIIRIFYCGRNVENIISDK